MKTVGNGSRHEEQKRERNNREKRARRKPMSLCVRGEARRRENMGDSVARTEEWEEETTYAIWGPNCYQRVTGDYFLIAMIKRARS